MKTIVRAVLVSALVLVSSVALAQSTTSDTAVDTQAGANNNLNIEGSGPSKSTAIGFGSVATAPPIPQATQCVTSESSALAVAWGLFSTSGSKQTVRDWCEFSDRWTHLVKTCSFKAAATMQRDFMAKSNVVMVVDPNEKDLSLTECLKPIVMDPPSAGKREPKPEVVPVPKPEVLPVPVPPKLPSKVTLMGDAMFDFDKATLKPGAMRLLDNMAADLSKLDLVFVSVTGHTDSKGSPAYNYKLSLQRAQSVRNYLVSRGIESFKVSASGKGLDEPIDTNATDEGRARNRRVEVQIMAIK